MSIKKNYYLPQFFLIEKSYIFAIGYFFIFVCSACLIARNGGRHKGGSRYSAYPAKPFRFIQRIWLQFFLLLSPSVSAFFIPPEESINNEQPGDRDLIPGVDEQLTCSFCHTFFPRLFRKYGQQRRSDTLRHRELINEKNVEVI